MAGNDLILALDMRVQRAAEQALAGKRAAVVAIDPNNGDVVAFVSMPTFDPNGFARGLSVSEYAALQNDIDKPLYDRALRGVYPPGSTIKPLVALAALEYGTTRSEDDADLPRSVPAARLEPPLPRLEEGRSRHGQHAQGDRRVLRHVLLRRRRSPWDRPDARLPDRVRARRRDRHRHRGRAIGARALEGLEEGRLQASRSADVVPRRDGDRGHRPGLHARDTAAARADGGDDRRPAASATRRGSSSASAT